MTARNSRIGMEEEAIASETQPLLNSQSSAGRISFSENPNGQVEQIPQHDFYYDDDDEASHPTTVNFAPQIFAATVATIGSFGLGTVFAWSAPALPDLATRGDLGHLTTEQTSWMASIAILGALVSAPAAGCLMDRLGRKFSMILMAIPFVIGWGLIAFAHNVEMVYFGRLLTGFAGGANTVFVPVYVGETADPKIRGALSSLMCFSLVTGILVTYVIGTFVSWSTLSTACGAVPIMLLIFMPFAPETPRYLVTNGNIRGAIKSLMFLRGASDQIHIRRELEELQAYVRVDKDDSTMWRHLIAKSSLIPTLICLILFFFQQMCGATAISFYTVEAFKAAGTTIDASLAAIFMVICQTLTVLVSTIAVDKVGRKSLMLTSEAIMATSLIGLAGFFYLKQSGHLKAVEALSWLPLICFTALIIGYSFGMGPIPWVVTSELLPAQSKALATSIVASFYWILTFVVAKTFYTMTDNLGLALSYGIFAIICMSGAAFIFFVIPETKGMSAMDIELIYERPSTVRRASMMSIRTSRLSGSVNYGGTA